MHCRGKRQGHETAVRQKQTENRAARAGLRPIACIYNGNREEKGSSAAAPPPCPEEREGESYISVS